MDRSPSIVSPCINLARSFLQRELLIVKREALGCYISALTGIFRAIEHFYPEDIEVAHKSLIEKVGREYLGKYETDHPGINTIQITSLGETYSFHTSSFRDGDPIETIPWQYLVNWARSVSTPLYIKSGGKIDKSTLNRVAYINVVKDYIEESERKVLKLRKK